MEDISLPQTLELEVISVFKDIVEVFLTGLSMVAGLLAIMAWE